MIISKKLVFILIVTLASVLIGISISYYNTKIVINKNSKIVIPQKDVMIIVGFDKETFNVEAYHNCNQLFSYSFEDNGAKTSWGITIEEDNGIFSYVDDVDGDGIPEFKIYNARDPNKSTLYLFVDGEFRIADVSDSKSKLE